MTALYDLDVAVTQTINSLSGQGGLDALMIGISQWGVPFLVLTVVGQWWSGADRRAKRHVLIAAGLAFILALGFNQLVLLGVDRMRPYLADVTTLLVPPSVDPSFPSDNATVAFAIAATFAFSVMRRQAVWFTLAAVAVAFSRVYIGIHYVGDVLGGAVTGLLAATVVNALYRPGSRFDRFLTGIL
jgi:undecaprenyl-diphosphatase